MTIMRFVDSAPVSGIRRTADGYAVAEVPVARTGTQVYAGYEVGRPDMPRAVGYRPPEAVFADSFLASIAHRPVTDDHPKEAVTSKNWRDLAHGYTGDTIRKDEANGLIYVPLMLADEDAIQRVERNEKREVSCGYTCDIEWTAGTTPEGEKYDFVQRPSTLNHVALVLRGRAGSSCRVGDSWQPINDEKEPIVGVKTITHDGVPIEVTDAAEAVINKLKAQLVDAGEKLADEESAHIATKAVIATKDGEIAALTQKVADGAITPAKLAEMVTARSALVAKAKAIHDADYTADDDSAIMRKAVEAKMGDAGKALNDGAIAGAFAVLSNSAPVTDAFRKTVADGVKPAEKFDPAADREKRKQSLGDAWMKPYGQKD